MPRRAPKTPPDPKPIVLLTNDDGFFREEIRILVRALKPVAVPYLIAPDREKSAVSMAVTLRQPLRLFRVGPRAWSVDGTPADCVYFALQKILPRRPDLLISGLNPGPNLGRQDVHYSGTVAAALQGMFFGIPSMAVSMIPDARGRFALDFSAGIVRLLAAAVLEHGLPEGTALSVNIPPPPVRGARITGLGWKFYEPEIIEKKDPRGGSYYWIGTGSPRHVGGADSDIAAVDRGFISITPLHTDKTDRPAVLSARLRRLARSLKI